MSPSDPSKTQSISSGQPPREMSPGDRAEDELQAALHRIASHIVDADRRHCRVLEDMQERLGQIGRHVDQTRAAVSEEHAGTLGRLEGEIAGLARRIDNLGQERQSQRDASPLEPELDEPWDARSAEALTRACELAEAEASTARRQGKAPQARTPEQGKTEPAARPPQASGNDRAWLEASFAGIAALLQQSLAESSPAEPLAALGRRLDQLETRLESLLGDMPARLAGDWLRIVEGHIKELSAHFEATSRQLARLDAVDEQLCQLARGLGEHQQGSQAPLAGLRDEAVELLIHTAAERAASQFAATLPAPDAAGEQRIQALEAVMQDYIAESRRGEETTSGILRTIEGALTRIIDRIDAMEAPAMQARAHDHAGEEGMDAEGERLAEAYAAGARVLGSRVAAPALDAADYAPPPANVHGVAAETASPGAIGAAAAADIPSSQELRASALRGKLKAQAAREEPVPAKPQPVDPHPVAAERAGSKSLLRAGARSRALMGSTLALLFAGGFLIVDLFMAGPPAGVQQEVVTDPAAAQPGAEPGQAKVQETPHPTGPRVPQDASADMPAVQPAALSPQAAAPGTDAVDNGALPPELAMPPAEIGSAALRSAAANGDVLAQFEVARRYADGNGVAQDHKLAFAWYERAATRGLAPAQFRLGAYYERGVGVAGDAERAKIWYRRAADQGYVRAMHNLAVLLVGKHPERADYATAVHWFQEAASRGFIDSQFNLATLHAHGRGVAKDLGKAYKWFALAARAGDAGAIRRLEEIKAQLELPEQKAAELEVAAWRKVEPVASTAGR